MAERVALWQADAIAAATGGAAHGDWVATGVSIDSRTVQPGDLFIALRGPNFDGHAFAAKALEAGAAAVLIAHRPDDLPEGAPSVLVADTFAGLQALGRAGRARATARIAGITGSVGKTGTKEALASCLRQLGPTYATTGSFNNHWGVPLSLARMAPTEVFGVFELGMNHAGEISPLTRMVQPDVAVITTIAPAHLGNFGSVDEIADAKAEIFEGVGSGGAAVLNRDNRYFERLADRARSQGIDRIWSFGEAAAADARLIDARLHADRSEVAALVRGQRLDYCISVPGKHWVVNSLAVLLSVVALGGDPGIAARALASLKPVKGRGNRLCVQLPSGEFTVVDESYNASPAAMEAAFQVVARMQPDGHGRRIAILGDMRELGVDSDALHAGLAPSLVAAGFDLVHCCGPHMGALWAALPERLRGVHAVDSAALAAPVAADIRPGDVVLVKGSLGSRMSAVMDALQSLGSAFADGPAPSARGN